MGLFGTCWRNDHSKKGVCCCTAAAGIVAALAVLTVIGVRYGRFNEKAALHMTPGDTRLISYSSRFCESLTLKNTGLPNNFNTTLVTVRSKPELSVNATTSITVIDLTLSYGLYQFWRFYLYPGSTIGLRACILNGKGMELDIVRGRKFGAWLKAPGSYQHLEKKFTITTKCSSGTMQSNNYTFEAEDEYYFAFIGLTDNSAGINGTLDFTSPEYAINETFIDSCSTGRQSVHGHSCTISVPYHSDSYGLILVEDISLGTYASSAAVDVEWTCNPRVWLYAIIVISPATFVVLLFSAIVTACWCAKTKRSSKYTPLHRPNPVQTPTANGTSDIMNYGVIEKNT